MWLRKLVSGLFDHVLDSTVIYCDNQSCVKLSENPVFHDRSKHIEIKYYFLRDKVQRGEVVLQYISIDEQIADILVKPLSKMKKFAYLRNKLGLVETTSLLKKEEITPRLGGSTDVLLIYGQSCSSSKNGRGWAVPFQSGKWFEIYDEQSFSSSENGPDQTVIFVMKMVR